MQKGCASGRRGGGGSGRCLLTCAGGITLGTRRTVASRSPHSLRPAKPASRTLLAATGNSGTEDSLPAPSLQTPWFCTSVDTKQPQHKTERREEAWGVRPPVLRGPCQPCCARRTPGDPRGLFPRFAVQRHPHPGGSSSAGAPLGTSPSAPRCSPLFKALPSKVWLRLTLLSFYFIIFFNFYF